MAESENIKNLLSDLSGLPGMIYQVRLDAADGSLKFPFVSAGSYEVYEISPEEIMRDANVLVEVIHPDDLESYYQSFIRTSQTLAPWYLEVRIVTRSGKLKWIKGSSKPYRQADNSILWNGIIMDITDQKKLENKLRQNEEVLRETSRLAKVGGWEIDLKTMQPSWSEEVLAIHDLGNAEPLNIQAALQLYGKTNRLRIVRAAVRTIKSKVPFELELPYITAAGAHLWIRFLGKVDYKNDEPCRLFGVLQDITEQRQAEAQMRVFFECSTDAHLLYDKTGIIDCNRAALDMLGFQNKAAVIGRQLSSFSPEYQPCGRRSDSFSTEVDEIVETKGYYQFEWLHQKSNGEVFPTEITLNPVVVNRKPAILAVWHNLTRRKQAEAQIKLSESRLMETQELTHSGSWEKDYITGQNYLSAEAFRIFGLEPSHISPADATLYAIIHPDDRAINAAAVHNVLNFKQPANYVLRILPEGQGQKYIQIISKPLIDNSGKVVKLYGSVLDITEQKNAEQRLLLKQQQLKTFIESSPVAIAMFDKNMHYIATSKVWMKVNDLEGVPIIGKSHYEVNPWLPEKWKQTHQRGLAGEVLKNDEDIFIHNDGKTDWIRWEVWPWYEKEQEVGGIIMFTEIITERKKAQEELIKAKEQAEQAAIAKSQFLSMMSHEIRTPMNAVIGITHLLLQNNPKPDQLENLKTLKFSAENLMVLINDILDFNKIEAGKIEFEEIDFSLTDLIRNIRHALAPQAEEKGVVMKLMLDDELPETIMGDPVRLAQVITNLVSNAVKFTSEGKIIIDATITEQNTETTTIHFSVSDTGIGIEPEKLEFIFERFTQARSDTTRNFGGTGLGLAISKRLLELQGSQIQVESMPGKGSRFFFFLKFKNSARKYAPKLSAKPVLAEKKSLSGIKILMAEDYAINVMVARQFLQNWDIDFDIAENGLAALDMVQKEDYDLVLMDLQMPEMDGYQATKEIRKLDHVKYQKLPIIALTASAMLDIKDKAFEVGMNDYISKPFNPNELYKKITQHVHNYRAFI